MGLSHDFKATLINMTKEQNEIMSEELKYNDNDSANRESNKHRN